MALMFTLIIAPNVQSVKNKQVMNEKEIKQVFCDPAWQPLKPRGEVYTREFTEVGWKSFSELHQL